MEGESIDLEVFPRQSRDKGDADYINCPMNQEQQFAREAPLSAEQANSRTSKKTGHIF